MAKSVKFKDNTYLDSSSIVHNKTKLSDILTYSTAEQKVGTWIDGKPIYRKVIQKDGIVSNNNNAVNHNISNFGTLVSARGYLFAQNQYYILPRPSAGNLSYYVELQVSSTQVKFPTGTNANFDYGLAIIEYTKTTD